MIVVASFTGLIRMILIILGILFLLRLLTQFINNKNNAEAERRLEKERSKLESEKRYVVNNSGKTKVIGSNKSDLNIEDVDFEELD